MKKSAYELLRWLESEPKIQELRSLAKELGVKLKRTMKKRDIMKKLRAKLEDSLRDERPSSSATSTGAEERKVVIEPSKPLSLPESYGKDKLVLLPVNPNWVYAYWDFSEETRRLIKEKAGKARFVIRFYDVTYIIFDGNNAHRTFEADVDLRWGNYYFNVPNPNADYLCQLGYLEEEKFVPLLTSNVVKTPPASPFYGKEEIWMKISRRLEIKRPSEGMKVNPVERIAGSSQMPAFVSTENVSGGGAFIWQLVRRGQSGGIR